MVAYGKKNFASAGEEELLCPSIVYGNIVEVLPDQVNNITNSIKLTKIKYDLKIAKNITP